MALLEQDLPESELETEPDAARPLLWTKEQYHRMSEMGLFDGLRVELIEGEIIEMPAIGSRHFTSVLLTSRALQKAFGEDQLVVPQNGFDAGPKSEPQPDVAVYEGNIRDFTHALPTTALLVVEVADSTLRSDRDKKARLYAARGIAEYWIVNLRDSVLEVHRRPAPLPDLPVAYQNVLTLTATDTIAPLAAPQSFIKVADLLP